MSWECGLVTDIAGVAFPALGSSSRFSMSHGVVASERI